jgi:hypothetical protein
MTGAGLTCPFCHSADVELVAAWGGQLITSQVRCRACNTHFEALRDDFGGAEGVAAGEGVAGVAGGARGDGVEGGESGEGGEGGEGQETPSTSS